MFKLRDSKSIAVAVMCSAVASASAQSITVDLNAYIGSSPSSTAVSGFGFGTLGSSPYFSPPVDPTATADYDMPSDEGQRHETTFVTSYGEFAHMGTSYSFTVDNALHTYLSGTSNLNASDELTFSNTDGATSGKYIVRVDVVKSASTINNLFANVSADGIFANNLTASTVLYSPEMNFTYDSPLSVSLSLMANADSGVQFGSFDSRSIGGGWDIYLSYYISDTGGADFANISQSTRSGTFYNVNPVPEPGSMAALALGVGGLLRRRAVRKG